MMACELRQRLDLKPSCSKWMDIMLLCTHSSLMNCFNKVIFLHFYNELQFHILSTDWKMLGLSFGIKISISSKSGHSIVVLWTVEVLCCGLEYNGQCSCASWLNWYEGLWEFFTCVSREQRSCVLSAIWSLRHLICVEFISELTDWLRLKWKL